MIEYIIRRLVMSIPVVIGITIIVFLMVRLLPGDPALFIAGENATPEEVENIRRQLGLDKPLHVQYYVFLSGLLRGDLGISTRSRLPVMKDIAIRFPNTIEISVLAMIFATSVGIAIGIISATKRYSIIDHAAMLVALFGVSMPVFWLGLLLMLFFSVYLHWLPAGGTGGGLNLILPSITLGAFSTAIIARTTRSSMLDVLRQDYIRTARSKGLKERIVIYKHALANSLIPVTTQIGIQFGTLLSGAVLTETVFAWNGVGRLLVLSILARDYPVVQGTVLIIALSFVFVNLATDILYTYIDPRIHYD